MKRVLLIIFAASGVLGALFFLVVLPNLRPSDAPLGSWPDYEQVSSLIQHSDQIIIAVYLDETVHVIPAISPVDDEAHGSVTEIYRRFKVEETLKGHGKRVKRSTSFGRPATAGKLRWKARMNSFRMK